MLNTPDIYKEIGKIADKKFRYDLENDLIPDYSKFDLKRAEKLAKKDYMAVIERLISKCPINNNYEKCQNDLNAYTERYIRENYPPMLPETMFNILDNYKQNEFSNMINPPLQAFILYVELLRQLYFYVQEKYIRKIQKNEILLAHNFVEYSLELLNGISSLLLGSNHNSVISVYRTFYENYIVFSYLQNHPILVDAFIAHVRIDDCILKMEQAKTYNAELSDEIKNEYNELLSKYGEHFDDSYGWTSAIITERNKRNLKTMYEESDLGETFNYYYKLACKYSHSTAFSLLVRPDFNQLVSFLYGIVDITSKEFETMFQNIRVNSTKEKVLLKQWLFVSSNNFLETLNQWYGNKKN